MKDFLGFRFGNIHTKDLHLTVVSSGDRYNKNLLPDNTDYTVEVPGGNGKYYFGQTYRTREFTVNVAFDDLDELTWRRISQIFSNDKPQDLIFDENPYKIYKAKLKSKPDFKYVCFKDRETGKRIYKGEGTFYFICYHPLAFGFNKYVVRAADYYKCLMPEQILNKNSINNNPYILNQKPKQLNGLIKDHYNVKPNMKTPWKGGYPSIEQVQWGELYFNPITHENKNNNNYTNQQENLENKLIIDVRDYWDNIPKWQETAKLLTTPTLDYDQELIYMPQYNKTNYYNMDTGLNKQNSLIGSRLLVYNPGDVPIDFELKLGNLTSDFRSNLQEYTFRVSRYNVQRLTIEQAVDWIGLKPKNKEDELAYKYGTHYFYITEPPSDGSNTPTYRELKAAHPTHCYITEPIPQEHLSHFIKLFYWQSNLLFNKIAEDGSIMPTTSDNNNKFYPDNININVYRHIFNHEQGIEFANRYDELRALCITDDERNELYWTTLKMAILDRYNELNEQLPENLKFFNNSYTYEDFVYDFISKPLEYIRTADDLNYGEFLFNITRMPQFYTFDYFDITNENFDKIPYAKCGCDLSPIEDYHREMTLPLFLDSESRMLYNMNEPKWENTPEFKKSYPNKEKNFFNYKPNKLIFNDNIKRGHWFQLPPGWSLIDISPLVDEELWGGKRWLDARPFDWGKNGEQEDFRNKFNKIYRAAAIEYLSENCPKEVFEKYESETTSYINNQKVEKTRGKPSEYSPAAIRNWLSQFDIETIEDYMQFRRWYEETTAYDKLEDTPYNQRVFSNKYDGSNIDMNVLIKSFGFELMHFRVENAEYGFLKLLAEYWRANSKKDSNDSISWNSEDVDDWWWYANDYIWNNFPPLYWGYADLLNHAQINYVPQFY